MRKGYRTDCLVMQILKVNKHEKTKYGLKKNCAKITEYDWGSYSEDEKMDCTLISIEKNFERKKISKLNVKLRVIDIDCSKKRLGSGKDQKHSEKTTGCFINLWIYVHLSKYETFNIQFSEKEILWTFLCQNYIELGLNLAAIRYNIRCNK